MFTEWLSDSPWMLPAAGLLIGTIAGAVARWNHFCTLGSLERHWYADDSHGLRTWILAGTVALLTTQLLIVLQWIDIQPSFYLTNQLPVFSLIVGGLLFGVGMALVGTCGFGALTRLGGGSLNSLVVVVVMGLTAFSTQHGLLSELRLAISGILVISVTSTSQSVPDVLETLTGISLRLPVALIATALLLYQIFRKTSYRSDRRSVVTGSVIGLCVTAGWIVTSTLHNVMYRQMQIESASFVLPPGELVFSAVAGTGGVPDYGVGMVVGVIIGAAIMAFVNKEVRWEACDDPRELGRHLMGAALMGIGGVLALGCTIGQGVSAASAMALSAPIVFISIVAGARIGLKVLVEGYTPWKRADNSQSGY